MHACQASGVIYGEESRKAVHETADSGHSGAGLRSIRARSIPAPLRQFEVASVKPASPGGRFSGAYMIAPGGRFIGSAITAARLIQESYDVRDFQITAGPSWIATERFDIEAKAEGWSTPEQLRPLVQALLVDRFSLALHREMKEMPIFALQIAKGGPKLNVSTSQTGPSIGGSRGRINARQVSLAMFAGRLGQVLGRSVTDGTQLSGEYDILLEWNPDDSISADAGSSKPSIFVALQEQLGLKLEAQKGSVAILVID